MKQDDFYCYVDVRGCATDPDDEGLAGTYMVSVKTSKPVNLAKLTKAQEDVIACQVLNAFHDEQGIEEVDDFSISVYLPNGIEISENDDHAEGETLIEASTDLCGSVSREDLPAALAHLPSSRMMDIQYFLRAAKRHGQDSDPDHEVGDLQAYMHVLWSLLTPIQKKVFILNESVQSTLEGALADNEYELSLVQGRDV